MAFTNQAREKHQPKKFNLSGWFREQGSIAADIENEYRERAHGSDDGPLVPLAPAEKLRVCADQFKSMQSELDSDGNLRDHEDVWRVQIVSSEGLVQVGYRFKNFEIKRVKSDGTGGKTTCTVEKLSYEDFVHYVEGGVFGKFKAVVSEEDYRWAGLGGPPNVGGSLQTIVFAPSERPKKAGGIVKRVDELYRARPSTPRSAQADTLSYCAIPCRQNRDKKFRLWDQD